MSARAHPLVADAAALELATLDEVLDRAVTSFPAGRLAVVSSFGPGSAVVLERLSALGHRLPVIFIDTLHHFPETLEHVERVRRRYDLDLRVHRPAPTRELFERRYGPKLWERDLDEYQRVTKVDPFRAATTDLDAWFTGRRRGQAATRATLPVVEPGAKLRLNPLAAWSRSEVWRFILEHALPYNPLHDHGYASIGDAPLTTPIAYGEPERAGRWRGTERVECGIHVG